MRNSMRAYATSVGWPGTSVAGSSVGPELLARTAVSVRTRRFGFQILSFVERRPNSEPLWSLHRPDMSWPQLQATKNAVTVMRDGPGSSPSGKTCKRDRRRPGTLSGGVEWRGVAVDRVLR